MFGSLTTKTSETTVAVEVAGPEDRHALHAGSITEAGGRGEPTAGIQVDGDAIRGPLD